MRANGRGAAAVLPSAGSTGGTDTLTGRWADTRPLCGTTEVLVTRPPPGGRRPKNRRTPSLASEDGRANSGALRRALEGSFFGARLRSLGGRLVSCATTPNKRERPNFCVCPSGDRFGCCFCGSAAALLPLTAPMADDEADFEEEEACVSGR